MLLAAAAAAAAAAATAAVAAAAAYARRCAHRYASVNYEDAGMQPADVVSLGLRVNQQPVDALARIVRRNKAVALGREMYE